MIMIFDETDTVAYHESRTCPYHEKHPGKPFAGCTCSMVVGRRKATAAERRENLKAELAKIQEAIDDLQARKDRINGELAAPDAPEGGHQ